MAISRGAGTEIIRTIHYHYDGANQTVQTLILGEKHHIYTVLSIICYCDYATTSVSDSLQVYLTGLDALDGTSAQNGFTGFLGSMRHYTRAIQPREAYAIYKEGYSGGNWLSDMFNKYKLKIAFMEDQKELNSILL